MDELDGRGMNVWTEKRYIHGWRRDEWMVGEGWMFGRVWMDGWKEMDGWLKRDG